MIKASKNTKNTTVASIFRKFDVIKIWVGFLQALTIHLFKPKKTIYKTTNLHIP
jgi:hypothetical protein